MNGKVRPVKPKDRRTLKQFIAQSSFEYVSHVVAEAKLESRSEGDAKKLACERLGISTATLYRVLVQPATSEALGHGKVYLMRHSCGAFKIGFTTGAPRFRESTLQAEDPQVELVQWWFGSTSDEATLHVMFAHRRVRGEWFNLSADDLQTMRAYLRGRRSLPKMKWPEDMAFEE